MKDESKEAYHTRRAQQELALAAAATDPVIKKIRLDLAACHAAQRERVERGIGNEEDRSDDHRQV